MSLTKKHVPAKPLLDPRSVTMAKRTQPDLQAELNLLVAEIAEQKRISPPDEHQAWDLVYDLESYELRMAARGRRYWWQDED